MLPVHNIRFAYLSLQSN